ncbi:SIR2-like domain-containing protein [Litorimonas haliclonae]
MDDGKDRMELLPADSLRGMRLGISASDSPDLARLGLLDTHFRMTLGEITRTVVIAEGSIYYGGHLQSNGITNFLIEELQRYGRRDRPLKVCLAWTVHRSMSADEIKEQKEYLGLFGEIHFLDPDGLLLDRHPNEPVKPKFSEEEHAASLSGLRTYMTSNTEARIVIGGKKTGFQGAMPGIVEEVLFSIENRQPLYLAGGFGGATLDVIRALRPDFAEWFPQIKGGNELDARLTDGLNHLVEIVKAEGWDGYENGLNDEENCLLAASYRPSEIAALVGKGLGRLSGDLEAAP